GRLRSAVHHGLDRHRRHRGQGLRAAGAGLHGAGRLRAAGGHRGRHGHGLLRRTPCGPGVCGGAVAPGRPAGRAGLRGRAGPVALWPAVVAVVPVREGAGGLGPDRVHRPHSLLSLCLRAGCPLGRHRALFRGGSGARAGRGAAGAMTPVEVGLMGIAALLILFLLLMPVAFSLVLSGFLGFALLTSLLAAPSLLARDFFSQLSSYGLTAITMFVLLGSYGLMAGMGERFYTAAHRFV